jgi:3-oxoacyl-(acyl-carrier-protein) synthase
MNNSISITGLGVICAIGNDATSVLSSLRNCESGIGAMKYLQTKHRELPVGEVKLSNDKMKQILGIDTSLPISRTSLMGAIAIRQALDNAGITSIEGKRVALISGTTVGGMDISELHYEQMQSDKSLSFLLQGNECGKSTEEMAELLNLHGVECCTI